MQLKEEQEERAPRGESDCTTKILVDSMEPFNAQQGRYKAWVAKTTSASDLNSPAIPDTVNGKKRRADVYDIDGLDTRSIADQSAREGVSSKG